jgi:hypothetical protein
MGASLAPAYGRAKTTGGRNSRFRAAIAKNKSTFALVQMNKATSPTGYVAKLKELGYAVEEPN